MRNHVDALIQQMKDSNPDIRRQGAIDIEKTGLHSQPQEVLSTLIMLLGDEKIAVREAAEQTLIHLGGREVVRALLPCLSDSSTTMLNYAIEILSRIGGTAIDLLLPLLESKDHDIRKFGCDILGNLRYADGVYDLIELLNDPHVNVAIAAGEALGEIGSPDAVPYLIRTLQHPDTWMKCIAVEALGKIGDPRTVDPFIEMSAYEDPIVLYTVIKAMGNLQDERVIPYILSILRSNAMFAPSAAQALQAIAARNGQIIYDQVKHEALGDVFVRLLSSDNHDVLQSAIHIVGHLQLQSSVHALGRLLEHPHVDIVEEAIHALVYFGDSGVKEIYDAFDRMFPALQPEFSVQQTAPLPTTKIPLIRKLGELRSSRALDLLIRALDESIADEIRVEVATAIGAILQTMSTEVNARAPKANEEHWAALAFEQLLKVLSDPCEALRISAVEALGVIGVQASYPPLLALLQDPSSDVREAASLALSRIHQISHEQKVEGVRHLLEAPADTVSDVGRAAALRTLYRLSGDEEAELMLQFLQDASSDVRVAAVEALRLFSTSTPQDATVPDRLSPCLEDEDVQVRIAAIHSLVTWSIRHLDGLAPTHPSVPLIRSRLLHAFFTSFQDSQPRVQYEACQQLANVLPHLNIDQNDSESVMNSLLALLEQHETMVKIAVVETLVQLKPYIHRVGKKVIPVLQRLLTDTHDVELQKVLQEALAELL